MTQPWHVIAPVTVDGATQMALDAGLLERLIAGQQPPTLRFYRWQPVALSLGYHQQQWPAPWQHLHYQGQPIDLVRRPTGGRAVLHQGDLTYAIALPLAGQQRQVAYQAICDALIQAWAALGVPLSYGTAGRGYRYQDSCFALATAADLVTPTGYKLIGSAQLRRDRAVLQHGSIRLWPDPDLYTQVFGTPMAATAPPAAVPAPPGEPWLAELCRLLVAALETSLSVRFTPRSLTEQELVWAQQRRGQFTIPAHSWPGTAASVLEDTVLHP